MRMLVPQTSALKIGTDVRNLLFPFYCSSRPDLLSLHVNSSPASTVTFSDRRHASTVTEIILPLAD